MDGPLLRSYLKIDPMVKEFYDALTGGTANAVEIAEDIVERSQREIQAETAAVVEEVKKVMDAQESIVAVLIQHEFLTKSSKM